MFVLSSICGETLSSIQESIGDFPDVGTVRERMMKLQERVSDMDSIVETTKENVNKVRTSPNSSKSSCPLDKTFFYVKTDKHRRKSFCLLASKLIKL